ncbi:hypothetical protein CPB84DRAFT_246024 [Gymnopilus junonius]|uniref:Uncharacterized protein n=1 Tax=Gymnopilus junonius TaxID=109634 RepID=A0A9P5TS30_GYMJU|nr:hypothetical protein CPB84DRAFT_246024 [Gymnopilus junonius]
MPTRRVNHIPTLPLDVLVAIIDETGCTKDIDTLHSCSLLCHDLLHHCRKHIFRTFDMQDAIGDHEQYFLKFNALLSRNPHLSTYARVVHLLEPPQFNVERASILCNPNLPKFLQRLTAVEKFGLYLGNEINWKDIGPAVQQGITQIITRPSCVDLSISNLQNIPRSVLDDCRFLKVLSVTCCRPEEELSDEQGYNYEDKKIINIPDDSFIHLDSASFFNSDGFVSELYPCSRGSSLKFSFSRLRQLTVTLAPRILDDIWKLIFSASQTLEELTVNQIIEVGYNPGINIPWVRFHDTPLALDTSRQVLRPHISLSFLHHLRRLSFTIIINPFPDHTIKQHVYEWCLLLRTSPPTLEEITIRFDLFFFMINDIENLFSSSDIAFFEDLDDTLSDNSVFHSLTHVKIEILLPEDYGCATESECSISDSESEELTSLRQIEHLVRRMMKLTLRSIGRRGVFSVEAKTGNNLN